jgi:hypothetical protein
MKDAPAATLRYRVARRQTARATRGRANTHRTYTEAKKSTSNAGITRARNQLANGLVCYIGNF